MITIKIEGFEDLAAAVVGALAAQKHDTPCICEKAIPVTPADEREKKKTEPVEECEAPPTKEAPPVEAAEPAAAEEPSEPEKPTRRRTREEIARDKENGMEERWQAALREYPDDSKEQIYARIYGGAQPVAGPEDEKPQPQASAPPAAPHPANPFQNTRWEVPSWAMEPAGGQ